MSCRGCPLVPLVFWIALSLIAEHCRAAAADELPWQPGSVVFGETYLYDARPLLATSGDPFRQAVAGRVNDDPVLDLFVRRGNHGQCFVDPTLFDAALSLPDDCYGVARLPGAAGDEILTTTASGLRAWTHDPDTGELLSRSIGNDVLWAGVARIGAAQLDSMYGVDLFGLAEDGTTAWILLATPSGFGTEIPIALADPAHSVVACDFSGDGQRQLVFLGSATLTIHGHDGSLRHQSPAPGGPVATVLAKDGGPAERVVWVDSTGANDALYTFDTSFLEGPFPIATVGAVGLAGGDLDGDGLDELVVTHRGSWSVSILQGLDSGVGATASQSIPTGLSGSAASNEAWPVIADLDGDGDRDLIVALQGDPAQAEEGIFVFLNGAVPHRQWRPRIEGAVTFDHGEPSQSGTPMGYLQIDAMEAVLPPPDATHVELALWRQPVLGSATLPSPEPGHSFCFDLTEDWTTGVLAVPDPDAGLVFWMQRYVVTDAATGQVVHAFPAAVFGFTTDNVIIGGEGLDYLMEHDGVFHSETVSSGYQEGSRSSSTIIDLIPIPDFEDDEEPGTGDGE